MPYRKSLMLLVYIAGIILTYDSPRRNLAIRFLQLIGCEVDQVTDAESAITKINSAPFDVVFMDIILPKMTG